MRMKAHDATVDRPTTIYELSAEGLLAVSGGENPDGGAPPPPDPGDGGLPPGGAPGSSAHVFTRM
jgi:hypothetical protein